MSLETLRHIYLRRVVATVFGALGIERTQSITRRMARGVFLLNTPGRRQAEARMRAALPNGSVPAVITAMYDHIARFWVECLFARRLLHDSSWRRFVRVENEVGLRGLHSNGRGCLLATAYYGNPAVAALALGQLFRPVHVIVDYLAQPQLRAWQQELYAHRWVRPVEHREAGRVVPDVLQTGGAVLMICEHERVRGQAVPVPFLGRVLECYPTLGRLARWYEVPIGVVTCRREMPGPFSFILTLHEIIEGGARPNFDEGRRGGNRGNSAAPPSRRCVTGETPVPQQGDDDAAVIRRALVVLEREIVAHPEQYYWSMPTRTGSETAASRRTRRTVSGSQTPSAADRSRDNREAVVAPEPRE